ncbi:MAG: YncE family protein, partial [Thermoplasmataceae archaeon]
MGRLLLTLSVLLVAIIFMGTSFVVATGHGNQFMVSGDNAHSAPYAQGNSIINASHVYTTTSSPEKTFIGGLSVHKDASVTNKVIQNITVGKNPAGVAFDSLNGYVYVTHDNSSIVSVINGSTNKVIQNITVGKNPAEVAFDSLNGYVYVTNRGSNNISVINGSTNKVIQSIAVGSSPAGVAFDSLNGHMYVANYNSSI